MAVINPGCRQGLEVVGEGEIWGGGATCCEIGNIYPAMTKLKRHVRRTEASSMAATPATQE